MEYLETSLVPSIKEKITQIAYNYACLNISMNHNGPKNFYSPVFNLIYFDEF